MARREPREIAAPDADGLPEFVDGATRSLEVAPRLIRPAGRRGTVTGAAWALALAALVAVGSLAGDRVTAESPDTAAATPTNRPEALGHRFPSTYMGAQLLNEVIRLDSPATTGVVVTTPRVRVTGTVLVRAERILVTLEARKNRRLEYELVEVRDLDGGIRPTRQPTFAMAFDLPLPRPNGTMWIVVTVYDERGLPLGSLRRAFEVGPLIEPGPWGGGPMTACLPAGPALATSC